MNTQEIHELAENIYDPQQTTVHEYPSAAAYAEDLHKYAHAAELGVGDRVLVGKGLSRLKYRAVSVGQTLAPRY